MAASPSGAEPKSTSSSSTPQPQTIQPVPEPATEVRPEKSPFDALLEMRSYSDVVEKLKPLMEDGYNEVPTGTAMMGIWAAKNMKWLDIAVALDETSYARVMKDSQEERGKRLCATGQIVQIEVERLKFGKVATGLLLTGRGNLFHFSAVGSSGDIVERSRARICGVVTGKYSYSNSGGGTGHTVQVVGMFDIVENHSAY